MIRLISPIFLFISSLGFGQQSLKENDSLLMNPEYSITKNTSSSENYSFLMSAIKISELEELLNFAGPFTVFAPSNTAFSKVANMSSATWLNSTNKKEVYALLTHHIIAGNFTSSKILKAMCSGNGKASFTTVLGDQLIATMHNGDIILTDEFGNSAKITKADANQCNGVIHEIDSVISPSIKKI